MTEQLLAENQRLRKALQSICDLEESPEEKYMDSFDVGWNAALVIPKAVAYEALCNLKQEYGDFSATVTSPLLKSSPKRPTDDWK